MGSVAPKYHLTYFNSQGKAEVSRLIFALAHEPFIDERVPKSASFVALKESLPFGQLPVLQIDGEGGPVLAQSRAIERFLARRFHLMGSGDVEEQQVDSVVEAVRDLTQAYSRSREDAASQKTFLSQTLPTFLQQLNQLAQRCSTSTAQDTLVGDSLTLADLAVYQVLTTPTPDQAAINGLIDTFPLIRASISRVANQPEIREWIASRPA